MSYECNACATNAIVQIIPSIFFSINLTLFLRYDFIPRTFENTLVFSGAFEGCDFPLGESIVYFRYSRK